MSVAERLDERAAVLGDAVAQQRLVRGQALQPARLPEALEQGGRALDIGEEDRDSRTGDRAGGLRDARWDVGARHRHIVTHAASRWHARGAPRRRPWSGRGASSPRTRLAPRQPPRQPADALYRPDDDGAEHYRAVRP